MLLAALLGCTQATALFVGRNLQPRLIIQRLEFVNFTAERDERGALSSLPISTIIDNVPPEYPSRLTRVSGTVRVFLQTQRGKTATLIPEHVLQILHEQTELRCPVANMMVASGTQMDIEWVDGTTTKEADDEGDNGGK
jgi:uncharacterized OsmC-like protein